ncbi:MAG: MFS transporter [Caldilineae bacterium]|nr:MAG: MFS transporter [Caldilineae bacterium]
MRKTTGVLAGPTLVRFLLLIIVIRLVRDTSVRMMYPFLPEYARGLGITLTAAGMLLTLRTGLVMLAPLVGHVADRRGQRRLLMLGFALEGLALLAFSFSTDFWSGLASIFLLGVSDAFVHPLLQGYVSEHAPVQRRGQAMVTVEYSWALTGIAVLPVVGWLIDSWGWPVPFRLLGAGSFVAVLLLAWVLPYDLPRQATRRPSLPREFLLTLRDRSAAATLLMNAMVFAAAETIFLLWGAQLERQFSLGPAELGRVAAIIGVAELTGSVTSSLIIDRLGKRRSVLAGTTLFLLLLASMPLLNRALWSLVMGLALVSMVFEYTIVSAIPLIGQQRPQSRTTMLAMGVMVAAIARSATDTGAAWIFERAGFLYAILCAFLLLLLGWLALWRGVEERAEKA